MPFLTRSSLLSVTFAFGLVCARGATVPSGTAPDPQSVVAEVGGEKLTLGELEHHSQKLLQARYQYYMAEREAVDSLIDEHLVDAQAAREHLTREQLLDREVNSKVKDATEDQLEVYYEGLQTDKPFAEVRDEIQKTIRTMRTAKVKSAYLSSLRSATVIRVAVTAPSADVQLGDAPLRGPSDAPVKIIEFADYECPYCQQVHPEIARLEREFEGKVAFAFKDFPLPMHTHAEKIAEAARCAAVQNKFWEYHDLLFESKSFGIPDLKEYSRAVKLDQAKFNTCLESGEKAQAVQNDLAQGKALGLSGTPSFFVNGHFVSGAVSYTMLRGMIQEQLDLVAPAGPRKPGSAEARVPGDRLEAKR